MSTEPSVRIGDELWNSLYDKYSVPRGYCIPVLTTKNFISSVLNEYGRPALPPQRFEENILEALKAMRSEDSNTQITPFNVAAFISNQAAPDRERNALAEIEHLLRTENMLDIQPDNFVSDVKQSYGRPVLHQRIWNALKAVDFQKTSQPKLIDQIVENLRHEDKMPPLSLDILYFDEIDFDLPAQKIDQLVQFSKRCWTEIIGEERRYQIPSKGRAVILAPNFLWETLNLIKVQFFREDNEAPGVKIKFRFSFDAKEIVQEIIIDRNGKFSGFHKLVNNYSVEIAIEAVALSFCRDLVLPGSVYEYTPNSHRKSSASEKVTKPSYPRKLARPQVKTKQANFMSWHEAQERARHYVTGFRRWVGDGYLASPEKHAQAKKAGVTLPIGYTWVKEHKRGSRGAALKLGKNGDLNQETIFSPPDRASTELSQILYSEEKS